MPLDDQEEIIADLVHNYVLPEVQKQYVRETIKKRQRQYLKTVHNAIYKKIEHLPKLRTYIFFLLNCEFKLETRKVN